MFLSNLEIEYKSNKVNNWLTNPYKIHQRLWMRDVTVSESIEHVKNN